MVLTFVVLIVAVGLFIWGRLSPDIVAMMSVLALYLAGILTTRQALAGFGDPTVVMIAALFVVGAGLSQTRVTVWFGGQILRLAGSSKLRLLVVLMIGTAALSAFISNTGTVATLMPAAVSAAWGIGSVPAQFLMPMAFAANSGGLLTLTGTPPNIVVADTLASAGYQPFGFFEYALIGLPLLICAVLYMIFLGRRLLPSRASGERPVDVDAALAELSEAYSFPGNVSRLRVRIGSSLVGKTVAEAALGPIHGAPLLEIERDGMLVDERKGQLDLVRDGLGRNHSGHKPLTPRSATVIRANDVLLVEGTPETIERIMVHFNLAVQPATRPAEPRVDRLLPREVGLAEVIIAPRSAYIGQTTTRGQINEKYNVQVLRVQRQGRTVDSEEVKLAIGDTMLVRGTWEAVSLLGNEHRNFVVVGSPAAMARQVPALKPQAFVAIAALVGMVVLMVTGMVPAVMAAVTAALVMVLGGCLTGQQAYRAISWRSVVLIAAMIPMSTALELTGGAELLANALVSTLGSVHPLALMAGIFVLTSSFSQVISNTATTILVAPIVLQAALSLGVSPYPLLMIVAVSASTAFLTPIGTTTNLMVMTPGDYRFNDYVKAGAPLLFVFLLVSLALVPLIWPL